MKSLITNLFLMFIIVYFLNGDSVQFPTATKYKIHTDLFYSFVSIQKQVGPFTFEITKIGTADIDTIQVFK